MKKIVVVVQHYERFMQLERTLKSIYKSKYQNFEVVVIDHDSPTFKENIIKLEEEFPNTLFLIKPKPNPENWYSCIVSHNFGLRTAIQYMKADILVVQDAECYHVGDVISKASEIKNDEYIAVGCLSTNKETCYRNDFEDAIEDIANECTIGAMNTDVNAWYNHPVYRAVEFGFCGIITSENMNKLNGYDERFMEGVSCGDVDFIRRVKILGLKRSIITEPFVVHQWHYDEHYSIDGKLWEKNIKLNELIATTELGYKATHIITQDF
jgi:predicted glycosyltransferase involved in capsule biosynthesis